MPGEPGVWGLLTIFVSTAGAVLIATVRTRGNRRSGRGEDRDDFGATIAELWRYIDEQKDKYDRREVEIGHRFHQLEGDLAVLRKSDLECHQEKRVMAEENRGLAARVAELERARRDP